MIDVDPDDPPRFESQAAYLRRHALLLPGEERLLTATDFVPEQLATLDDQRLKPHRQTE